ncbi:polyhydroxyalkanoate synthesis regulator phasin [Algoriphagus iocasae]|uniref:Polyhydroxyalkanoate synthesis regulator phasin n=1 Tax=Algoriphagus iocasae TaxID=1836499 RepID=A0A841MFL7_9BACT|nr:hypothetical protein [Algoriphagus iocasae]MBB6326942.1 polyhydroxyalkanoate synthesis regulator phasin [Algoriphagus iocasae]
MGSGNYINKLVQGVRGEIPTPGEEKMPESINSGKVEKEERNPEVDELLERIRDYKVNGENRRLIRMDSKIEDVFKHVNYLFGIKVTSLVNYVCWDFLENNPELVNEIKKSLNQLKL